MRILHWALILIAIILPISIVCRNVVNSRFAAIKDEVRINNAIDAATKDAIDQIIEVAQSWTFDEEFGDVINITPNLAQEAIDSFFYTMGINFNLPFQIDDSSVAARNTTKSYIKNYFGSYVPAVLVLAYDGFYIYSQETTSERIFHL